MRDRENEAKEREAGSERKKGRRQRKEKNQRDHKQERNLTRKKKTGLRQIRNLSNRRSKTNEGGLLLSLLFSALQKPQAACLPVPLPVPLPCPANQDDHLPLPSLLKKSSPPSNSRDYKKKSSEFLT